MMVLLLAIVYVVLSVLYTARLLDPLWAATFLIPAAVGTWVGLMSPSTWPTQFARNAGLIATPQAVFAMIHPTSIEPPGLTVGALMFFVGLIVANAATWAVKTIFNTRRRE